MKRNRNFLLIVWAASLLGLSAVRTAHAVEMTAGFYIPARLGVYEAKVDTAMAKSLVTEKDSVSLNGTTHGLLSSNEFDRAKRSYDLLAAFGSKLLFLTFEWELASEELASVALGHAQVKVFVGNDEVKPLGDSVKRSFLTFADKIYVIPFSGVEEVRGRVEIDPYPYGEKEIYEAVITRGEADNITALRWFKITDSIANKSDDVIFEKIAGEDGRLQPEDGWVISFKDLDKPTAASVRGRVDSLYFKTFDVGSQVHIIRNGKDTITVAGQPAAANGGYNVKYDHVGQEVYRAKINAGNRYTIAVTARDSVTKGYYHFTLLDDTIKPELKPDNSAHYDSLKFRLKDLYVYATDNPARRYDLIVESDGKTGFKEDTTAYRVTVTAPWDLLEVGYDFHDKDAFDAANKNVGVVKYPLSGEKFIEVRVRNTSETPEEDKGDKKGYADTTYVIRVLSGNKQLKSLRLSSDREGKKPIELTLDSTGKNYTSAIVDYNTPFVYAWAAPEDANAKVKDTKEVWRKDTAATGTGEFYRALTLTRTRVKGGGAETFNIPVWAEDSVLKENYTVTVKVKWNLDLDGVDIKGTGKELRYNKEQLRDQTEFSIQIPAHIDFDDVDIQWNAKDEAYFRVVKKVDVSNGGYSYVVTVTAREDKTKKEYTFNLLYPSSDASLSYLAVPGFELSPAFDPAILAYTVIVPSEQASINFIAQARHTEAKIAGNREHTLHGDSTFAIVVTAEDGTKKTYTVTVTSNTNTGIQLAGGLSVQVYVSDQSLHVSTPAAERVSVYSAGGQLLYSLNKPTGKAFVSTFPKGVLIVKGSSGWVKKVALH